MDKTLTNAEQSDEVLVRLSLELGGQYFGHLVKRHSDYLFGLGLRLSNGDDAMAKDMSQQAFVNAFNYLASFNAHHSGLGADKTKRFRNWLTGIAINCFNDLNRAEAKYVGLNGDQLNQLSHSHQAEASKPISNEFLAMIRPLTMEQRQLITLRFVYEFKIDEIAGMLGQKNGSIKSKISRAVDRLRDPASTAPAPNGGIYSDSQTDSKPHEEVQHERI